MKYTTLLVLISAVAATQVEYNTISNESLVEIDAKPCVYLDETIAELEYQLEMFSRTLDPRHWTNVTNIYGALKTKGMKNLPKLQVKTWDLMDKAFAFPRIRRYNFVCENMDMLEHFQDNLNTNISNTVHMENFLRVANTVRTNLLTKYHDGEFVDPALFDPKAELTA
jgi:hypothetical protein